MRAVEFVTEQGVAEGSLTEIENIDQSQYRGGKDTLDRYSTPGKKHLRALPGGSDLMYSITSDAYGSYVHIVDPGIPGITKPSIVASLSLVKGVIPDSVQVGAITVDEDYRGRGLARALYGIVLTIMKKTLISGSSQTPGGRRNWLSLASIPGVEIKGLLDLAYFQLDKSRQVDNTIDQLMQLGGQFVAKNNNYTYWAFDVVPGNGQLTPAVKNKLSKLYGYDSDNLLMATWTGGQQAVAEGQEKNHWYDAGVKDATRGARPNPRTYLPTLKDKQAKHPEEVDFYMNGYKSVKQGVAEDAENFNGIDISIEVQGDEVMVRATAGGRELGHVLFVEEDEYLMPQDLEVEERFQGQGIAAAMYDYVKSKGYRIRRSGQQTDAGAGFWGKHRPEQNVWENFADGRNPQDKGDSQRHGIPKGATMAELEKASHAAGRKGQLARWQLNMRRGQKK
jgi:GNAT superfamily N-acetyltransferase